MAPNPLTLSTRERILAYLQENRTATVSELSRAWNLTRADIRYNLNTLIEDQLVEVIPRDLNQPAGRGRPTQKYRLALHTAPDNLIDLCASLLTVLMSTTGGQEENGAILHQLANQMCPALEAGPGATQRFSQAMAFLNQHAYQARWEAHASGPRILLRHCPYAAVLSSHPELCQLDQLILERLIQQPLQQTARMNQDTGKPPACIFSASSSSRLMIA